MIKKVYRQIRKPIDALRFYKSRKVICIGRNKTGTTSMKVLFKEMGLSVGRQRTGELLIHEWAKNDFDSLIKFVKYGGEAFQDVPFSLPRTFKVLDEAFPDAKFILTIRDSPEVWYKSVTTFHGKLFGKGNIPTKQDLQQAQYVYPGWMWESNRLIYETPEDDIYDKETLIQSYQDHNNAVIEHFKDRPDKLLVLNLKEENAHLKVAQFLGVKKVPKNIPWANKTPEKARA